MYKLEVSIEVVFLITRALINSEVRSFLHSFTNILKYTKLNIKKHRTPSEDGKCVEPPKRRV
jgi:hypothetical protein